MDTPSTSTDRRPTRRWPLVVAAGLLAGGLIVFVAFQVFPRPDANERATDLARRMVISQNLDEIEAMIIPRFEIRPVAGSSSTSPSTAQRLTMWLAGRPGSYTDCAALAPPKRVLALGKRLVRRRSRIRWARPSMGTRLLSRWWTAKRLTWTQGTDARPIGVETHRGRHDSSTRTTLVVRLPASPRARPGALDSPRSRSGVPQFAALLLYQVAFGRRQDIGTEKGRLTARPVRLLLVKLDQARRIEDNSAMVPHD